MAIILNNPHRKPLPWGSILMFNIDFKCNRVPGCEFCYNKLMDTNQEPATEEIIFQVAKQADENKTRAIMIVGGEPLVSDALIPALEIFQTHRVHPIITTNGDKINESLMEAIYARGCDHIALSISDMYDFEMSIPRLKILEKIGFNVTISATHTKANHGYFLQLINTLAQFPAVTTITKQALILHPLFESITPTQDQSDEIAIGMYGIQQSYLDTPLKLLRRPLDNLALKHLIKGLPAPTCGPDWRGEPPRILPNGDIINCIAHGEPLGNITTHSIKEIGENVTELQDRTIKNCPYYQNLKIYHPHTLTGVTK